MEYRISGHESFPCRYAWLPKVVRNLADNPLLFSNEENAMVELGVGKNMVRSMRFWAQTAGVANPIRGGGYGLTELGKSVLGTNGSDPFLEDIRTLWLLHWNLSTATPSPLLAWDFLLNRWQDPEFTQRTALLALRKEADMSTDKPLSPDTLERHFETFLHTYVPTRGHKGEVQEDNLDCPLVELELIARIGERESAEHHGRREPIYAFRREEKPEITSGLFLFCLNDFWSKRHGPEKTLTLRHVTYGHGSPGQVFKIPEEDIRSRLESLKELTDGYYTYAESANLQQLNRKGEGNIGQLLQEIYTSEVAHV